MRARRVGECLIALVCIVAIATPSAQAGVLLAPEALRLMAALMSGPKIAKVVVPAVSRARLDARPPFPAQIQSSAPGPVRQRPVIVTPAPRQRGVPGAPPRLPKPVDPKAVAPDPLSVQAHRRNAAGRSMVLPGSNGAVRSPLSVSPPVRRSPGARRRAMDIATSPSYTGINPWWQYEEDAIPGVGKYMANVGPGGNLLVQADDMNVPNKGVALAFRRTYNSLSQHDYANTDGSTPSNYGTGWTNTFDAHMSVIGSLSNITGLAVYDIDGARYSYLPDGQGGWASATPGQYAKLVYAGGYGYQWFKKSGTVYTFYRPDMALVAPSAAAYAGRIQTITGRNYNNLLGFTYLWDNGDSSSSANLNQITVTSEAGQSVLLLFADHNGQRLLQTLVYPDGVTKVGYAYDAQGNLAEVDLPPNNVSVSQCWGGLTSCLPTWYGYNNGLINWVAGPRWAGRWYGLTENGQYAGTEVLFEFDASAALYRVDYFGYMNPTPSDGTNTPVQPGLPNDGSAYRRALFSRTAGNTAWSDTDGHSTSYLYDAQGRVTQRGAWTGSTTLNTTLGWDAQNNLVAATDARGYETDYAYDNNGNAIAVAQPAVTTSQGRFRPTSLYSYDAYNNVVAYCDPIFTHARGLDWTAPPAPNDSLARRTSAAPAPRRPRS